MARRSVSFVERGQELGDVVAIGGVFAREACGTHPGRPSERRDFEAGVVGDGSLTRRRDERDGLEPGVLLQCLARLLDLGDALRSSDELDQAAELRP